MMGVSLVNIDIFLFKLGFVIILIIIVGFWYFYLNKLLNCKSCLKIKWDFIVLCII